MSGHPIKSDSPAPPKALTSSSSLFVLFLVLLTIGRVFFVYCLCDRNVSSVRAGPRLSWSSLYPHCLAYSRSLIVTCLMSKGSKLKIMGSDVFMLQKRKLRPRRVKMPSVNLLVPATLLPRALSLVASSSVLQGLWSQHMVMVRLSIWEELFPEQLQRQKYPVCTLIS